MITLFITHFVADFLLQSREMGQRKSKEIKYLLKHLGIIHMMFVVPACLIMGLDQGIKFTFLNTFFHGIIDALIWKVYPLTVYYRRHKLKHLFSPSSLVSSDMTFRYWEDKVFYSFIGLDQMLHYATIILLFSSLT